MANTARYLELRADALVEPDDDDRVADRVGAKYGSACGPTTSPHHAPQQPHGLRDIGQQGLLGGHRRLDWECRCDHTMHHTKGV